MCAENLITLRVCEASCRRLLSQHDRIQGSGEYLCNGFSSPSRPFCQEIRTRRRELALLILLCEHSFLFQILIGILKEEEQTLTGYKAQRERKKGRGEEERF